MDFEGFMAAAGYAETTKRVYRRYAEMLGEASQERVDLMVAAHPGRTFRSFLRTYIVEFQRRQDIIIPRTRGHRRRVSPRYLSKPEVAAVREACTDPQVRLFIEVALATGLRVTEMLSLTPNVLRSGRIRMKGNVEVDFPALPKNLMVQLYSLEVVNQDAPVFKFTRGAIYHRLVKLGKRALGKPVTPHDLRRTFAMSERAKGKPIEVVRRRLRHTNIETTARYYDVPEEELREKWGK